MNQWSSAIAGFLNSPGEAMENQLRLLDVPSDRPQTDWEVDSQGYDPSWEEEPVRVQEKPETQQNRTLTCGKLEDAIKVAHNLSDQDLELLGDAVTSMLQARGLVRVQEEPETQQNRTLTNKKATPQGSFERKYVRKRGRQHGPYLYLRWWSNGVHKSTYVT